ncbi:MAG: CPBP family glutamic-type intramembrane protease [Cyanobacteriota bacterium]|nr:CPBP family glutamic-type intramembrane protease [Cyanobacteriota bacterium]
MRKIGPWRIGLGALTRWLTALLLVVCALQGLLSPLAFSAPSPRGTPTQPLPQSSEALARRSPWSRPESYPLSQRPRSDLYRPSAQWIGRLVLPTPRDLADPLAPKDDWVWIVPEQTPKGQQGLIGKRLRLRWADLPHLRQLVATVTTDIRLGEEARQAEAQGNVVPTRLDGRSAGPLQTLAGGRPGDDVTVELEGVSPGDGELRISSPPVQITGRWQGLVTVLGPASGEDLWRVGHFNRASARFDGVEETIRIPALPPDRYGRRMIDPAGLAGSPFNGGGWLIQGAPATDGVFTVQALHPYAFFQLTPRRVVRGTDGSLAFLHHDNWGPATLQRGTLQSTALIPKGKPVPGWGLGERALLMHLFGGIGGVDGEPVTGWTATGHFSFGEAEVVRDGFTGQPRLGIRYHQIYASNPNGILAGSQDWSAYAGSLQRGWIGLRPFSDVLVPIGGAVLDAIALQAELIAARYRSGDGTGVALVTPSTSCVQDAGPALWLAIRQLREQGEAIPMSAFDRERLRELGLAFDRLLKPFGQVRGDWANNAARALAAGTGGAAKPSPHVGDGLFETSQSLRDAMLSWRSILPRSAHDLFAAEFLRVGLPLLVVRSNQIPGADPRMEPIAPTVLFGQLPLVPTLLGRLGDSLFPEWNPTGRLWTLGIGIGYGVLAVLLVRRSGLRPQALGLLFFPALGEEVVFRVLLLPSALEGFRPLALVPWVALSVGLFVAWHALTARPGRGALQIAPADPRMLLQSSLLGLACALAYLVSGSIWPPVGIHWLAAMVWRQGPRGGVPPT